MAKLETAKVQDYIADLGKQFGFLVEKESSIIRRDGYYSPIADVVWYLNMEDYFDLASITPLFKENPRWLQLIKKMPFAGFEIEGSTTSSKNQISNFANLYSSQSLYKFIVVNNSAAGKENDTYRRGVKINQYFQGACGSKNVIFIDKQHILKSMENFSVNKEEQKICVGDTVDSRRSTFGGETTSVEIYEMVIPFLMDTGMEIRQNYSPEKYRWAYYRDNHIHELAISFHPESEFYLNKMGYKEPVTKEIRKHTKITDSYYIPKLDVVAGFYAPQVFVKWLKAIALSLEYDSIHYPLLFALKYNKVQDIFIPAISMEIETTVGKHMNGGIINMSRNSFCGVLAANKEAANHLKTFRDFLSCNNVILYEWRRIDP